MKSQINIRVSDMTRRQLDDLTAHLGTSITETITVAIDRLYQQEQQAVTATRITRTWLEKWVATNRPEIGLHENNGHKGFYRLDTGPAFSFRICGPTWRDVAAMLEAVESKEPA